jgi:hypothetical protein
LQQFIDLRGPLEIDFSFLVNAMSTGPRFGNELVTNSGFTQGLTGWTATGAYGLDNSNSLLRLGRNSWAGATNLLTNGDFAAAAGGADNPQVAVVTTIAGVTGQNTIQSIEIPVADGTWSLKLNDQQTYPLTGPTDLADFQPPGAPFFAYLHTHLLSDPDGLLPVDAILRIKIRKQRYPDEPAPFVDASAQTTAAYGPKGWQVLLQAADLDTIGILTLLGTAPGCTDATLVFNIGSPAERIQAALEALSNVNPGDVIVTQVTDHKWSIEFAGQYAGLDVPLLEIDANFFGNAAIDITLTQLGFDTPTIYGIASEKAYPRLQPDSGIDSNPQIHSPINILFHYSLAPPAVSPAETSGPLAASWKAANAQAVLRAMGSFGRGTVLVDTYQPSFGPWQDHFVIIVQRYIDELGDDGVAHVSPTTPRTRLFMEPNGPAGSDCWRQMHVDMFGGAPLGDGFGLFTVGTRGNTIFQLSVDPTADSFALTVSVPLSATPTAQTSSLATNASISDVRSALEALPNIGPGNVTVTGGPLPTAAITIEFTGQVGRGHSGNIELQGIAPFTNFPTTVAKTQTALAGVSEVQTIALTGGTEAGGWRLRQGSQPTANMSSTPGAATVAAALTSVLGANTVTVTGAVGGPYQVTFRGSLAATNVPELVGVTGGLAGWNREHHANYTGTTVEIGNYGDGTIWQAATVDVAETYRVQLQISDIAGTARLTAADGGGTSLLDELLPASPGAYVSGNILTTDATTTVEVQTDVGAGDHVTLRAVTLAPWSGTLSQTVAGLVPGLEHRLNITLWSSDGSGSASVVDANDSEIATLTLESTTVFKTVQVAFIATTETVTIRIRSPADHVLQIKSVSLKSETMTGGVGDESRLHIRLVPHSGKKNDVGNRHLLPYELTGSYPHLKATWLKLNPRQAAQLTLVVFGCNAVDGDSLTVTVQAKLNGQDYGFIEETVSISLQCVDTKAICADE